jgi:hypothetical protein
MILVRCKYRTHSVCSTKSRATRRRLLTILVVLRYLRHPSYFGWFWWVVGTQALLTNPLCLVGYTIVSWKFFDARIRSVHAQKTQVPRHVSLVAVVCGPPVAWCCIQVQCKHKRMPEVVPDVLVRLDVEYMQVLLGTHQFCVFMVPQIRGGDARKVLPRPVPGLPCPDDRRDTLHKLRPSVASQTHSSPARLCPDRHKAWHA